MQFWQKYLLHSFSTAVRSGAQPSFFSSSQSAYGMEEDFISRSLVESKFWDFGSVMANNYLIKFLFRFERELEALRKELAESAGRSPVSATSDSLSRGASQSDIPSMFSEPIDPVGNGLASPHEISESKKDLWPTSDKRFIILIDVSCTNIMHILIQTWWVQNDGWPLFIVLSKLHYGCTFFILIFCNDLLNDWFTC